jgi:hypothetical protein
LIRFKKFPEKQTWEKQEKWRELGKKREKGKRKDAAFDFGN